MKQLRKDIWDGAGKNWKSLLLFEIVYRSCTAFLVSAGAERLLRLLLREQGYSYLTADNLAEFLTYPQTVLAAAVSALMVFFLMLLEVCALLACFEAGWRKERITVPGMAAAGLCGAAAVVRRRPLRWIWYIAGSAPYLAFPLLLRFFFQVGGGVFTGEGDLRKMLTAALAAAVLFCSAASVRKLSFRVLRPELNGKAGKVSCAVLVQVSVLIVSGLLYLAAAILMTAAVCLAGDPESRVSAVVLYSSRIRSVFGAAAGVSGTVAGLLYAFLQFARTEKPPLAEKTGTMGNAFRKNRYREGWKKDRRRARGTGAVLASRAAVLMAVAAALYLGAGGFFRSGTAQHSVRVTAHRGGARMAPENTVSAIESAIRSRADYAEIDVQETKDGEIVLLHDSSLERVAGIGRRIWELTYAEVSRLDAGSWFDESFQNERIPTLEAAIECCRGKIRLNIEMKYNGHNKKIVEKVVRIIEEQNFEKSCVVTSMNYEYLEKVKKLNPSIATGYTMPVAYGDLSELAAADFFSVSFAYLSAEFVRDAHALGKAVCVWTLNDPADMQQAIEYGADNIITDDPELVRRVFLGGTGEEPSFSELLAYALK